MRTQHPRECLGGEYGVVARLFRAERRGVWDLGGILKCRESTNYQTGYNFLKWLVNTTYAQIYVWQTPIFTTMDSEGK